jgi:hypothetical protein
MSNYQGGCGRRLSSPALPKNTVASEISLQWGRDDPVWFD